ncbi:MAG TPA: LysM domain-containing protein [Phototrophicaceae bacterium]|jgi:hypothetical protein|nr:LysM domain-containing protein [Phototrophicaceae bacterium]
MMLRNLSRPLLLALSAAVLLTACTFNSDLPTPTAEGIDVPVNPFPDVNESATPTLTSTPSQSPSPEIAMLESKTPTGSPLPPTETLTLTPTEGPIEYKVQSGDTLILILQQHGYFNIDVISAVQTLNPSIDVNNLQAGRTILIPRPSSTPTPIGFEQTAIANSTLGITPIKSIADNAPIDCYNVQEGDNPVSIAENFNTTLEVLHQLNPDIYFPSTCDFNIRSGGEDCNVLINIGQCVRVPYPTPTITLSPTPSGSETPTATPTYAPPRIISPPNGAIISGSIPLEWVSVGVLKPDEVYFVQIRDVNNPDEVPVNRAIRSNTVMLPEEVIPNDGQDHIFQWSVAVARRNPQGTAYAIIGSISPWQQFTLKSR